MISNPSYSEPINLRYAQFLLHFFVNGLPGGVVLDDETNDEEQYHSLI